MLINRTFVVTQLFVGQVISGFGQSMVWVAQGDYVAFYGTEQTKGIFFAIFWSLYTGSLVVGNLLSAQLIKNASGVLFYFLMGSIILVTETCFLFLKYPL